MSPLARELLARTEVPLVAYVSCDPDTLARDLDHFTRLEYGITTLRPLDMIPLTAEVETIALLCRSGLAAPKVRGGGAGIVRTSIMAPRARAGTTRARAARARTSDGAAPGAEAQAQ
jgi:hypothetical protein